MYWNISQNTNRDVGNKIQHNWPFLVLCKILSIDSRRDECDQYDPGRLMTVDDSQRVSGTLRAVDGAGSLKCHLAENYPDPVIENAKKWIPDQKIMTTCSVRVRAFSKIAEMGNFSIQKFHRPPQSHFGRFDNFLTPLIYSGNLVLIRYESI